MCGKTFQTRNDMMIHRKTSHPMAVRKCDKFNQNNCRFNNDSCWFLHEQNHKDSKDDSVDDNDEENSKEEENIPLVFQKSP